LLDSSKLSQKEKTNEVFSLEVEKMVRHHLTYVMYMMALEIVQKNEFKDNKCREVLELVIKVYAINQIMSDTQALYECGFFTAGSGRLLQQSFK
jgi:hypothetical protein